MPPDDPKKLTPEEEALWEEMMRDVKKPSSQKPAPKKPQRNPETQVDDFDDIEEPAPAAPHDMAYFEAFVDGRVTLEDIPDGQPPEQAHPAPDPAPRIRHHQQQPQKKPFTIAENSAHKLAGWRSGVDNKTLKNLSRGKINPTLDVDLHGYTLLEAFAEIRALLAWAQQERHKCVLIIHGKGRREGREMGAIKQNLAGFLSERQEVLAFHTAHRRHGGSGACYVLIRKRP